MQYDFTLPANGGMNIETAGRFVKYVSGVGKIRVRFDKGGYIDLLPGQGANGLDFSRLTIEDRSGAGNVGVLLAGAFAFQDDRISGTVDVIDGGRSRTLGGNAFLVYGGMAATAGQYAVIQLFNPATSGRNVFVEGWAAQTSGVAAGGMALRTTTIETLAGFSAPVGGLSKRVGAPGSLAKMTGGPVVSLPAGSQTIMNLDKTKREYIFREPMMLSPGTGIFVFNTTPNEDMGVTYEYFEEAVQ